MTLQAEAAIYLGMHEQRQNRAGTHHEVLRPSCPTVQIRSGFSRLDVLLLEAGPKMERREEVMCSFVFSPKLCAGSSSSHSLTSPPPSNGAIPPPPPPAVPDRRGGVTHTHTHTPIRREREGGGGVVGWCGGLREMLGWSIACAGCDRYRTCRLVRTYYSKE